MSYSSINNHGLTPWCLNRAEVKNCKELSISLDKVLLLTWEQFDFLLDGLSWNCRAMTKKGQKENEIIAMKTLSDKKYL